MLKLCIGAVASGVAEAIGKATGGDENNHQSAVVVGRVLAVIHTDDI